MSATPAPTKEGKDEAQQHWRPWWCLLEDDCLENDNQNMPTAAAVAAAADSEAKSGPVWWIMTEYCLPAREEGSEEEEHLDFRGCKALLDAAIKAHWASATESAALAAALLPLDASDPPAGSEWDTPIGLPVPTTLLTEGSKVLAHLGKSCRPCTFFWRKADGCHKGDDCEFCHFAHEGSLVQTGWGSRNRKSNRKAGREA